MNIEVIYLHVVSKSSPDAKDPEFYFHYHKRFAEHVMGWDLKSEPFHFFRTHDCIYFPEPSSCAQTFKPTEDPAAAMKVLEKCLEKAESDVCFFKSSDKPGYYRVFRMLDVLPGRDTPFVEAETLPLAITLFAKKLFSK